MVKVSIILPTNRYNSDMMIRLNNIQEGLRRVDIINDRIFTDEFLRLLDYYMDGINHYLELTLRSLERQRYKNFELIITHRNPIDALAIIKAYGKKVNYKIKLVEEKPSIWHSLGNYPTLINNINTGVIHSEGELIWRIDDMVFFNENTLRELVRLYQFNHYGTSPVVKNISYNKNIKFDRAQRDKIGNKIIYQKKGFYGIIKNITDKPFAEIPKSMTWGYSSTINIHDFLEVNGQDELWDGSITGTDMELGERISRVSTYRRMRTKQYVYELDDTVGNSIKKSIRDDVIFRNMISIPTKANSWKPTKEEMDAYEKWHLSKYGSIDSNWKKMLDVPFYDFKEEYKLKRLGRVIYEN